MSEHAEPGLPAATGGNIFLVGPMGAGKTTVGRRLARMLELCFVDSDHEIEASTGVDIPYIFEREGETGFRKREAEKIAELVTQCGIVLATGGGAVLDAGTRQKLSRHGLVVYLNASLQQQLERTARSPNRPLLKDVDRKQTLSQLFRQRDPLYREVADLVVEPRKRHARIVAMEIVRGMAQVEADQQAGQLTRAPLRRGWRRRHGRHS